MSAEPEPFSLLLPVYRGDVPRYLEKAFTSAVHDQTLRPAEVVIVQDGPIPDQLAETLEQLIEASPVPARVVRLERNEGLAVALSRGLEACEHELIARMDADDVALPDRFAKQLPALTEQELDLIGSGMFEFRDDTGAIQGRRTPPIGQSQIERYARFHDPFNHPTVVYRRSAVARAGGYRPLGLMEDYWLFVRMIQSGARVGNLPDPLVMYRIGAGAYKRRGGMRQLVAELRLQRELRRSRFTTRSQCLRNVLLRATYRLVPVAVRKPLYRRLVAKGAR